VHGGILRRSSLQRRHCHSRVGPTGFRGSPCCRCVHPYHSARPARGDQHSLIVALQLNMSVQVGPGASPDTDVGPVISPAALQRMHQQIGTATEERARLVLDGRHLSVPGYEHGAHVSIFGKHAWNAEWNGMDWNGTERNGMEWNGMEWNGVEWNGMEFCESAADVTESAEVTSNETPLSPGCGCKVDSNALSCCASLRLFGQLVVTCIAANIQCRSCKCVLTTWSSSTCMSAG
jgi:Aldehyde dehydrogenase family